MTLGEIISQIETQTGTSITDPVLLTRRVLIETDNGECPVTEVDVDGDVIVLH